MCRQTSVVVISSGGESRAEAKPKSRDLYRWTITFYRSLRSLRSVEMTRLGGFVESLNYRQTSSPFSASTVMVLSLSSSPERMRRAISVSTLLCR